MTSTVLYKSVFSIEPFNNKKKKKNSMWFLVDYQIKIVILFECELINKTDYEIR
jgi:hypothetical protein